MSEWIKCSDRLPEDKTPILMISNCAGPRRDYTTDAYCGWRINAHDVWARWPHETAPTHWMPLPEPPK